MKALLVSSIQRYALHDGPGIRTTVFFIGCPLECAWCHNPECIVPRATVLYHAERCAGCGACAGACPAGALRMDTQSGLQYDRALCVACGLCADVCPSSARELSARQYMPQELARVLVRDMPFYRASGGGVTLSGGEVMTQNPEAIGELLLRLGEHGVSVIVDTCGYAPWDRFQAVLPCIDRFLYDLKAFNAALHRRLTGQDNALILDNLKRLSDVGAKVDLRIPVIGGANDGLADWEAAAVWLKRNVCVESIHLLPYHNTGIYKYERLGRSAHVFSVPASESLQAIQEIFIAQGFADPVIGG